MEEARCQLALRCPGLLLGWETGGPLTVTFRPHHTPWLPSPETHRRPDHLPTKTLGSGIGDNIIYYFESELPGPAGDRGVRKQACEDCQ